MTTSTTTTSTRRRRLVAAALALPLSLAMTGSAFATGSTLEQSAGAGSAESRTAALVAPTVSGGAAPGKAGEKTAEPQAAAASRAAADKAASDKAAADKAADRAAADKAASDKAASDKAASDKAAPKPERTSTGSAAGSAAGAATAPGGGGTYVNGNTSSSKADRPTAPVPGTPSQPLSKADRNGTGANPGQTCTHSYCSNGTGLPTGNGVGDGASVGQPCAGCVGKADNKNPKGQAPNGSDHNAGYECDRNQGIGQTNPAHTGCTTGTTSPAPVKTSKPTTPKAPHSPTVPGNGTADITVSVDCFTVTVTSSKDISHVELFFADGSSVKYDGLSGRSWTSPTQSKAIVRATAKSATSRKTASRSGTCGGTSPTTPATPPATLCPNGTPMPAGGSCGIGGSTPGTPVTGGETVTICHATGSTTNPYVARTVSTTGLQGHGDHAGDLIPMPVGGCPSGSTPPSDVCPDMDGIQVPGTPCSTGGNGGGGTGGGGNGGGGTGGGGTGGGGNGGGGTALCPDGSVMPGSNPASCPTAPPVCPTVMPAVGPVQAGCQVPPTQGGGEIEMPTTPIGGVTPDQSVVIPTAPVSAVTPNQPTATVPVPVGPPTGIRPQGSTPQLIAGLPTRAAQARAVPSALPFTGTDAALLVELGALLLLAGGGLAVAARRERTARAA